jgi:hypothetical protein
MLGPFDEVMQALKQRAGTSVRVTVRFSGPWGKARDKKSFRKFRPIPEAARLRLQERYRMVDGEA